MNLVLATGKIGREGCGYGAITGQGNGQGGREHGQKADQLPGYRSIENEADRAYVASVWGVDPASLPGKGVSAYEMMEKVHDQEIRALLVMGSNPVVSNPNVRLVEEGLRKLDFLIVADMFLSETARMADLVLPVTSYMENEGTLTNLEGRVLLREQGGLRREKRSMIGIYYAGLPRNWVKLLILNMTLLRISLMSFGWRVVAEWLITMALPMSVCVTRKGYTGRVLPSKIREKDCCSVNDSLTRTAKRHLHLNPARAGMIYLRSSP